MSDLKPSPFCGHPVSRDRVNDEYRADIIGNEPDTCEACCNSFNMSDDEWNTRPTEDALTAKLEASQAALRDVMNEHADTVDKLTAMHRRAQTAESAAMAKAGPGEPNLGRALANAGYNQQKERADIAEAKLEALRVAAGFAHIPWQDYPQLADALDVAFGKDGW